MSARYFSALIETEKYFSDLNGNCEMKKSQLTACVTSEHHSLFLVKYSFYHRLDDDEMFWEEKRKTLDFSHEPRAL